MAESDSPLPGALWAIPAPLVLVATVALLSFFGLQRTSREAGNRNAVSPQPPANAAGASDSTAASRAPAIELLRRYLNEVRGGDVSRDRTDVERGFRELKDELNDLRSAHPFQMQCLVATVPDPIDSHLQLMFDASLAAMTRACEQHGYVLDRYELPWSKELRERPVTGRPDVRKYRLPGAVLFRKSRETIRSNEGETCNLLMLLLVGETPTGGIRKSSLCAALDFVAAWNLNSPQRPPNLSVELLGPTFSGSSPSLRWCVFDWTKEPQLSLYRKIKVDIVSGSATADSNRHILTASRVSTSAGSRRAPPLDMTFQSTVIPDRVTMRHLSEHLFKERRIEKEEIALLVEGNTSYGQGLTSHDKDGNQPDAGKSVGFEGVLVLPFPMALSRIRSEYEQSEAQRIDSVREMPRAPRRNLKLPLDPPPYATDVLPTFATGVSAVTDLTLEQILGTISRRGIRAVGIFGTDIRDKLFLAQQVRRYAPNVQLFMIESDLLYTHADYAPYLSGTLIASTYPLFTQNQQWTGSAPKELLFPADTAEGVYNATTLLLNRPHRTNKPQSLLDYSYPFEDQPKLWSVPPLWLTMAGESRLWPVKAIPLDQSDGNHSVARTGFNPPPTDARFRVDPPSWIPAVVASLISLAFVGVFWVASGPPSIFVWRFQPQRLYVSKNLARIRASCRWLALPRAAATLHLLTVFFFFLALLFLQTLLCSPTIVFVHIMCFWHAAGGYWWAVLLSLTAGAVLLWVLLALIFRLLFTIRVLIPHTPTDSREVVGEGTKRLRTVLRRRRLVAGVIQILIATSIGIVVSYLLPMFNYIPPEERTQAAVFVERVGTLSSGVTWLVPAVLLAAILGCWAGCQLWRLHFSKIYPLADPLSPKRDAPSDARGTGEPEGIHTAGFSSRIRDLDGRLKSAWFVPTELVDWLFLVLLAFGLIYVLGVRWVGTAEDWIFDLSFRWAAGLAIMLIGWSQIHVKSVGGLFERLLRRMAQHAMVSAYDRIPDRLAAKAAGQIFAASPHPGDFDQPVRCLTQLAEEAPCTWADARQDAREARHQFAELLDCSRSQKEDVDRRAAELNCRLADIAARQLAPRLLPYWNRKAIVRGRDQETEDKKDASSEPTKWETQAEVFLAMQFVTLIRQVFAHIKNQLTFLVLMLLCLLGAFHAYPFQPSGLIMQLCYGLTLWCLVTAVLLIIRFNRCEVLSRLSNTTPNRFTFDRTLVLPMITFVVIPLCSLLAVQFPGIGRMLFGWLAACRDSLPT